MPRCCLMLAVALVLPGFATRAEAGEPTTARRDLRPPKVVTVKPVETVKPVQVNLSGRWLMTLPAGYQYLAKIERSDNGAGYRLDCRAGNLRGEYVAREGRRFVFRSEDVPLAGLTWSIKNANLLVLTEQPIPSPVGADYRGAVLVRIDGIDFGE